jgi:hypothetical protein
MAALVTLERAKVYLGVASSTQDTLLLDLINLASAACANYCNRQLTSGERSDLLTGRGKRLVRLRECPVTSVTSVEVDGVAAPAAGAVGQPGWRLQGNELDIIPTPPWRSEVRVSYVAGYADDAIPDDLQLACLLELGRLYRRRDKAGIASETLANQSVAYNSGGVLPETAAMLASYRRVVWPT